MQCTTIHKIGFDTVFSRCESGNDSEGVSDDITILYITILYIILVWYYRLLSGHALLKSLKL